MRDDLAQRVQALGAEPIDVHLGAAWVNDTRNTNYIIRHGKASIPFLVEALNETNAVAVGYAAYCLTKIGAVEGKVAAETALSKLNRTPILGMDERFAVGLLDSYLKSIARPNSR